MHNTVNENGGGIFVENAVIDINGASSFIGNSAQGSEHPMVEVEFMW